MIIFTAFCIIGVDTGSRKKIIQEGGDKELARPYLIGTSCTIASQIIGDPFVEQAQIGHPITEIYADSSCKLGCVITRRLGEGIIIDTDILVKTHKIEAGYRIFYFDTIESVPVADISDWYDVLNVHKPIKATIRRIITEIIGTHYC